MLMIRKTFSDVPVKVVGEKETENGTVTVIEMLVTPFGDARRVDLHKEFFDADTYFGDDLVKTKFGLYEHMLNNKSNPILREKSPEDQIKTQMLGPATLIKTDDAGRWFQMEILRSHEYHDAILDMIDLKILGTSTQTFQNSKVLDENIPGKITVWIENEVSLTPTPADPKTIGNVLELKSLAALPPLRWVKNDGEVVELTPDLIAEWAAEDGIFADSDTDVTADADFVAAVGELLDEDDTTRALQIELGPDAQEVLAKLVSTEIRKIFMEVRLDIWGDDIEEIRTALADMIGAKSQLDALKLQSEQTQKGLLTLARWLKKFKTHAAGEEYIQMSQVERDLVREVEQALEADTSKDMVTLQGSRRPHSALPVGAPGTQN